MTTIATLKKIKDGYKGELRTLSLNAPVTLVPTGNNNDRAPDFQILAGDEIEIGGAWERTSKSGNSYLSVRLDDPSFSAPVYANLIERDGAHVLIWSR